MKNFKENANYRYVTIKLDGICLAVEGPKALTRIGTDLSFKLAHLPWFWRASEFSSVGELWYPGKPASYVKSALKDRDPGLRYTIFDIPALPRGMALEMVETWLKQRYELDFVEFKEWDGTHPKDMYEGHEEGFVFCDGLGVNLAKWKPVLTADLIIAGFTEGNGKYIGLVGSMILVTNSGRVMANVSGFDDFLRLDMSERPNQFIGKVVEVAYQYVGSKGKLRHPRFIRFRDKLPEDCTNEQFEGIKK